MMAVPTSVELLTTDELAGGGVTVATPDIKRVVIEETRGGGFNVLGKEGGKVEEGATVLVATRLPLGLLTP